MMLRTTTIAILIVLGLCCFSVGAQDENFKKLAPEPIVLQAENGSGSVRITFVRNAGIQTPLWKVTEAVGPTNRISERDIQFQWIDPPPASNEKELVIGQISLNTQTFIEPGVAYKGTLILLPANAQPLTISYTIENPTSASFDLFPEKSEIVLDQFQPTEIRLRAKNTGKSKLTELRLSGLDLVDAATGHRLSLATNNVPVDINPGQEKELSYRMPQPTLAGVYSGSLDVTANQSSRKAMPLVIRSRGPNFGKVFFLPFVLFVAVLAITFWVSSKVEDWFGQGGLQRAQAVLSLQKSQNEVVELQGTLKKWEAAHKPAVVPKNKLGIEELADELVLALKNAAATPLTDLTNEAQRFATEVMAKNIFWSILQTATKQFPDLTKLAPLTTELDVVVLPQPLDLNGYRDSLRKALQAAITAAGLGGAPSLPADSAKVSAEDLQAKIKRMARVYRVLVWIVVFVTAYQTLYFNNKAFGTFLDYIAVFLWTLGLTATGTTIISKAHSSYTPPTK